jgi:hypothetical protein
MLEKTEGSILDCSLRFSLTFIRPVSCVPNGACVSGLYILYCPFRFSLTFIRPVSCVPNVACVSRVHKTQDE